MLTEIEKRRDPAALQNASAQPALDIAATFWSAAVFLPLSRSATGKRVVFQERPSHSNPMRDPVISWPHAPTHQLSETGTYFVTAGTYLKAHYFRTRDHLDVLHRGLLKIAQDFSWQLEAWAVFSNHYHFVGRSPEDAEESTSLPKMLTVLHRRTAIWLNRLDKTPGRKIWHISGRRNLPIRNHT
jgi:REP element-mobilizing transposase RayT